MAAATISRSTRGLCLIISVMGLLRFASSQDVNLKLVEMKAQLQQLEEFLKTQRANIESQCRGTSLILKQTAANVRILRRESTLSAPELDSIERYTDNTNYRVRGTFREIAETLEYHESKLEEMKALVKYAELMNEMQPLTASI